MSDYKIKRLPSAQGEVTEYNPPEPEPVDISQIPPCEHNMGFTFDEIRSKNIYTGEDYGLAWTEKQCNKCGAIFVTDKDGKPMK